VLGAQEVLKMRHEVNVLEEFCDCAFFLFLDLREGEFRGRTHFTGTQVGL
jgi:hypothetical protein